MDETNKDKTLAEAISQIETLTAEKTKLDSDLANASSRIAEIAAQSGVSPIEADANGGEEESLEELAKRIDEAQGVEKAKLIESNYDRIMSALKGVY